MFSNSSTDLYFLYELLSITAVMRIQSSSHEGGTHPLCMFMLQFVQFVQFCSTLNIKIVQLDKEKVGKPVSDLLWSIYRIPEFDPKHAAAGITHF